MLIMLHINAVYFITCIGFFQYAMGGIFGIVLHCWVHIVAQGRGKVTFQVIRGMAKQT
jgi:hypothetical protein